MPDSLPIIYITCFAFSISLLYSGPEHLNGVWDVQSRTVVCGDSLSAFTQNQTCLNFSAKKHSDISQKWFDLAHILLSTQVRVFILPLAFLHERTYNPVQAEGKYKPAENSLLTVCILFCSYCEQEKKREREKKSGDINYSCNFGDVVWLVGNREVTVYKEKKSLDFLNIKCERGGFAAKDMTCSDRQSDCVWPNSIFSMS